MHEHPPHHEGSGTKGDTATLWRNGSIAGVELFHGNFTNYTFARHFHPLTAFGAVESGAMRSWHRDRDHTLAPGTVLLFNPGDVHAPFPANDGRWSFRMFYLPDALLEELGPPFAKGPVRFAAPFPTDPALARKILTLHRELEDRCERIAFDCSLLEIFEAIAHRHAEQGIGTPALVAPKAIARMQEYIHAYAENELTLDVLAGVANLSPYHALRSFRKALGLPPHKYLLQVRAERAKALLRDGESIAGVAATLGFSDQSHLTRHFKRIFGVSPAQSLRFIASGPADAPIKLRVHPRPHRLSPSLGTG